MTEASSRPTISECITTRQLRQSIERSPRVELAHLPTPLEALPRFSEALGGPPLFIKRDDCTGLVFGGNKTRHNEFLLAHALEQGADMFVWGAGVQSNNCRQTAAACAKFGLDCHLLLSRSCFSDEVQGNLLIDYLVGATVEIVDAPIGPELDDLIAIRAKELQAKGRHVYCWDRHVVKPIAAVSYVECMCEIVEQMENLAGNGANGKEISAVYVCSAGSTGAGLALAKAALGCDFPVRHIAPICWPWDLQEDMAKIANAAAELLDLPHRLQPEEIDATEAYVGKDYGVPTDEGMEALTLLARTEGILLDPVYTGKAMSALIDDIRHDRLPADQPVVFVHTGGTPALFAYRDEMVEAARNAS